MQASYAYAVLSTVMLGAQAAHPAWVIGNLTYPFGNLTDEGADQLPIYLGHNAAEGCPGSLKFHCPPCHGGCDRQKGSNVTKDDHRPCRSIFACHHYPKKDWQEHSDSEAEVEDLTYSDSAAEALSPTTRREILERALAWVTSNFEYKYYQSSKSRALRPTANLEGCAATSSAPCPVSHYLSDCSGMVGMAWRTTEKNPSPNYFKGERVSSRINCSDLLPGDAIIVGSEHIILFRSWQGQSPQDGTLNYVGWQMGGGWGKANQFHSHIKQIETCHRRLNLANTSASLVVV